MAGDSEVEPSSYFVLIALGVFFVAAMIYVVSLPVRALCKVLPQKKRETPKRQAPSPEESSRSAKRVAEPQKPGMSMKQLMKKTNQVTSRTQAGVVDKATHHPLFLNTLKGHTDHVGGLAFSADGSSIATACDDRVVRLFKLSNAAAKNLTFMKHNMTSNPVDVAFGSASNLLAVTTKGIVQEANLSMVHLASNKSSEQHTLWQVPNSHDGREAILLQSAHRSDTSGILLSCSAKNEMRLFSFAGKQLASVDAAGLHNHMAAVSPDGRFFAAATFTSDVKVHEVRYDKQGGFQSSAKVMDLKGHRSQILCLTFSPDSTKMVTASKDGTWRVWNIDVRYRQQEDAKCLLQHQQEVPAGAAYSHLAWGPTGQLAAACDNSIHFLDSSTGGIIDTVEGAHEAAISSLEWAPKLLIAGSESTAVLATAALDRKVRLWRSPQA
ncbi:hypothetical protein ABBQ32_008481 [Trebouxia sp. C0010 RCD-2024]